MNKIALLIFLILPSCAISGRSIVILQEPSSKQMAECKIDYYGNYNPYAAVEACADAYKKAGYVEMGGY